MNGLNRILEDFEVSEKEKVDEPAKDTEQDTGDLMQAEHVNTNESTLVQRKPILAETLNKSFGDQERTLLHIAATQSHKVIIQRLLEAGADPAIKYVVSNVAKNLIDNRNVALKS